MDINIVPIATGHIKGFHKVLDIVARERKFLAFLEAPPFEQTSQFVENNIAHKHPQFVAVANDQVVGWCDILPKCGAIHPHVGILGMGLLSEFRRMGIGANLLQTTLLDASGKGLSKIALNVRVDNAAAIDLYKKFGFITEGELVDDAFVDGQFTNTFIMAKINH
ncbi:MAG: GNAT family N-acetyltransferase [Rhizobiaceae bacterium]|nr:GNAT family N-acetyltransferase [Rhizobiaceae bacterium]